MYVCASIKWRTILINKCIYIIIVGVGVVVVMVVVAVVVVVVVVVDIDDVKIVNRREQCNVWMPR
jgi:hypothetical protein